MVNGKITSGGDDENITNFYDVVEAIGNMVKATTLAERRNLHALIDKWGEDFPEDMGWVMGAQSPALIHMLFMEIITSSQDASDTK